jgi:DNA-binding response OmpR family regulator
MSKANILIVEADTPIAMRMICFLTDAGCEVRIARTVKAGMELALETKFDLIVLDVDLPGGFEIYCELKQRHFTRHTPVVFVSERSSLEDQQQGLGAGAADYITKPFDTSDFVQRILACAEKRKGIAKIIEGAMT